MSFCPVLGLEAYSNSFFHEYLMRNSPIIVWKDDMNLFNETDNIYVLKSPHAQLKLARVKLRHVDVYHFV